MDKKISVLLVDDDEDFLVQQRIRLEQLGMKVVTAGGRAEAEKLAAAEKPSVAVIDLMMEEMDGGFVLAYNLKKLYPELPVIMVTAVTADTGIEFAAGAQAKGSWIKADAILAKPVRTEQLAGVIERFTA